MVMSLRRPHEGSRRLVVAIDVGTTSSGASYCILNSGHAHIVQGVNRCVSISAYGLSPCSTHCRYPGQDTDAGPAKVPSVMYYDGDGFVRAIGAEALLESNIETARARKWEKVQWCCILLPKFPMRFSDCIVASKHTFTLNNFSRMDIIGTHYRLRRLSKLSWAISCATSITAPDTTLKKLTLMTPQYGDP